MLSPTLETAIAGFIEHRKEMKKPMTPRAITMLRHHVEQGLATLHTEAEIVQAMEYAIMAGWRMFYLRDLSIDEQRRRWQTSPDQFWHYLTPQQRQRYNTL